MLKDRITRVVIEAKLNASDTVNYAMKDDFAQLFLEAIYADREENSLQQRTLTDGTMWHLFTVNMRSKPLEFTTYLKAVKPQMVCNGINSFLCKGL